MELFSPLSINVYIQSRIDVETWEKKKTPLETRYVVRYSKINVVELVLVVVIRFF